MPDAAHSYSLAVSTSNKPFFVLTALVAAISLALTSAAASETACRRSRFETKLVGDACATGGTPAAKEAMKKWVKGAKAKQGNLECASCHAKLAPGYELKPDGLAMFKKLGGE